MAIRKDLSVQKDDIESLFIEIKQVNTRNVIVGCMYRPPNRNPANFIEKINEIANKLKTEKKMCCVTEDFSLNPITNQHESRKTPPH